MLSFNSQLPPFMRCGKKRLEDSVLHDPVRYIHLRLSRRLCPPLPFLRICYRTIIQVIFKELGYYIGLKKKKKKIKRVVPWMPP